MFANPDLAGARGNWCSQVFKKGTQKITQGKVKTAQGLKKRGQAAKKFFGDLRESFGLNLLLRNVPSVEQYSKHFYGGFVSIQQRNQLLTWRNAPFSKSMTLFFDLPFYGAKYLVTKVSLKQIDRFLVDRESPNYISISVSPPKNPTAQDIDVYRELFKKIKKDNSKIINGKSIAPIVVDGFASREFLNSKGISTVFLDMLNEVFPNRESYFVDGKDFTGMRVEMANRLEEMGGTAYFFGDLEPAGVKQEIEVYSKRDFAMKHLEVSLLNGPFEYWTQHPKVKSAMGWLASKRQKTAEPDESWFYGPKQPRMLSVIALSILVATMPITRGAWKLYENIDPASVLLEKAGIEATTAAANIDKTLVEQKVKFHIKTDPRFKDILKIHPDGTSPKQMEKAHGRLEKLKAILRESKIPPGEMSKGNYQAIAELIKKIKSQEGDPLASLDIVNWAEQSLSESQKKILHRLSYLNNSLFSDIALLAVPAQEGEVPQWVETYTKLGFLFARDDNPLWSPFEPESLAQLDHSIQNRVLNLLEFDLVPKAMEKRIDIKKLPKHVSERIALRISDPFAKKIMELRDQGKIDKLAFGRLALTWLEYVHFYEFYESIGVYKEYQGRKITMEMVESSLLSTVK